MRMRLDNPPRLLLIAGLNRVHDHPVFPVGLFVITLNRDPVMNALRRHIAFKQVIRDSHQFSRFRATQNHPRKTTPTNPLHQTPASPKPPPAAKPCRPVHDGYTLPKECTNRNLNPRRVSLLHLPDSRTPDSSAAKGA